jgi:hypothetical protein
VAQAPALQAEIRQLVIDPYIVDLVCRDVKLAIELDGSQHADAQTYDERHICKAKAGRSFAYGTTRSKRILTVLRNSS